MVGRAWADEPRNAAKAASVRELVAIVFDTLKFMRRTFIIFACILFSYLAYGQNLPGREATQKEQELMDRSHDCARVKSIPLSERLRLYPFNKATQIQLVSFKSNYDTAAGEYYYDSLPRMNDTVCYSKLFEVKTLMSYQVDTLTDLIYNYGFKFKYKAKGNVYFIGSVSQCYNPRNAILFLDKDNTVFEFIEICFECERTRTSSDKVSLGTACNQKLQLIKSFFKDVGLDYGITKGFMTDD